MMIKRLLMALAVTGLAVSQSIGDSVPACAAPCLTSGITSATTCSVTDAACQCTVDNYRAIYTAALTCVLNGCGADVAIGPSLGECVSETWCANRILPQTGQVLPAAERFCLDAVGPISAPPVGETTAATAPTPATTERPTTHAPAPDTTPGSVTGSIIPPSGSFQSSIGTSPTSASSAAVVQATGAANPASVGSWLAIGAALVAFGA